jgi:hypothetical protein
MTMGCTKPEMQRCVDENNRVVDDSFCADQPQANQQNQNGSVIPRPIFHYYYGGWGGFGRGTVVGGGSPTPLEGHSYALSSGKVTIRGGFGSFFRNLFHFNFHGVGT